MISVKKDYNSIPPILESEEVENFRNSWISIYYFQGENYSEPKVDKNIYTDISVANALNEIYQNKCAMCETKLYDNFVITQYRPITQYPWLAYEWSNLILLCKSCNTAKRERFPLRVEKKKNTSPPRSFYDWRADSALFLQETAILMNPEIHNIEKSLEINLNGELIEGDLSYENNGLFSVDKTIEIYDLNRIDLLHAREKIINLYITAFSLRMNEYLKNDFQKIELNSLITLTDKSFDAFFKSLLLSRTSNKEYSFVYKYFFENFSKIILRALKDKAYKFVIESLYKIYIIGTKDFLSLQEYLIEYQKASGLGEKKTNLSTQEMFFMDLPEISKIESVEVKNFFSIENISILALSSKKEIYFLGENGDGKTLLLQAILLALKQQVIRYQLPSSITGKILDIIDPKSIQGKEELIKPTFNAVDDDGNVYKAANGDEKYRAPAHDAIYAYGVHRSRNDSDRRDYSGFMTLFDSESYLNSPIKWLQNLHYKDLAKATNESSTDTISLSVAKEILENLLGEERDLIIDVTPDAVTFKEKGTFISFDQLSEGYKSVMTWVCDLLSRLVNNYPEVRPKKNSKGYVYLEYEAIVLVDEIDLHLHPKWANKIVSKLRTWFPNIQFFFTTHSPIVLLGASREAVFYKVYKEDGVTKISQPLESISSLTANTILTSPLFGLEDAISDAYDSDKDEPDTEDDFLYTVIHRQIKEKVKQIAGVTENDIMKLVNEELEKLEAKEK